MKQTLSLLLATSFVLAAPLALACNDCPHGSHATHARATTHVASNNGSRSQPVAANSSSRSNSGTRAQPVAHNSPQRTNTRR